MSIELDDDFLEQALNSDNDENENGNMIVPRPVKKLKKRSRVWEFFEEFTENGILYARCKLCVDIDKTTQYAMSGKSKGGTGNMTRHLESEHVGEVILGTFQEDDHFVFSQEKFREALIKWIIVCDQPFTEPQQDTFIELIRTLNPKAILISDKTVRSDVIATYEEKFEAVKKSVAEIPGKLSISMDGWTSKNVLPFLAIRGHWLDRDWKYHSILFDFAYIRGTHSGWKHSCIFRDCFSRLEIPISKILCVTLDNASNNDTFFNWMEEHGLTTLENHLRCLCHIFNLAVQDLLKLLKVSAPEDSTSDIDDTEFENEVLDEIEMNEDIDLEEEEEEQTPIDNTAIIVNLRSLVKKIRKSVKLRQKLKKCCAIFGVDYRVPIIDVKHRWNSTYHMISRAKELRDVLHALCTHTNSLTSLQITEEQWSYLTDVEKLLAKFDRATKYMSMERHPTITSNISVFNWLVDSVQEFSRKNSGTLKYAAEGALSKLKKYEVKVTQSIIPFIGTILHPALKMTYFKEHGYTTVELREIRKAVSDYFTQNYETAEDIDPVESSSEDELRSHMFKRSRIERTSSELAQYLSLPLADPKVDLLSYWKSQAELFPRLTMMARDILSAQSASTSVERDFSTGTRMVTPQRCSLLESTIRASMLLKSWFNSGI